jgi:hypothetical protein
MPHNEEYTRISDRLTHMRGTSFTPFASSLRQALRANGGTEGILLRSASDPFVIVYRNFGVHSGFLHVILWNISSTVNSSTRRHHAYLFSSHTQKSSSVSSSSQSTASSACSPSACNLSRPVRASKNPVSLNALNIIAKPCVSYAFTTYAHQSVSLRSHSRSQTPGRTYRLAASGTAVISCADYRHGTELREESAQLVWYEP